MLAAAWVCTLLGLAPADGPPASRTIAGIVVDEDGQPIAGADVFLATRTNRDGSLPDAPRTTTDAQGRFAIDGPRTPADSVWAHHEGRLPAGVGVSQSYVWDGPGTPLRLTLSPLPKSAPGRLQARLLGPGDRPAADLKVTPEYLLDMRDSMSGGGGLPAAFAARLAGQVDANGSVTFPGLSGGFLIRTIRVEGPGVASQVPPVERRPAGDVAVVRPVPARLSGRVIDEDGRPVAGASASVWRIQDVPSPVRFDGKAAFATDADGRFEMPPGLLAGTPYRVAVERDGFGVLLSTRIRLDADGPAPASLELVLKRLRTVSGRILDRQDRPIAGARVFQSGDGPARTEATTDADGRFRLGGFNAGKGFLFAERDGFRFRGRIVDATAPEPPAADLVLSRLDEEPVERKTRLPDLLSRDEQRALGLKVLRPYLKLVMERGSDGDKQWVLRALAVLDPAETLAYLDRDVFTPRFRARLTSSVRRAVVIGLAETAPDEATAVIETITDPSDRAQSYVDLADEVPATDRARRLALLDQAMLQVKGDSAKDRLPMLGAVARRLLDLGEEEKATKLLQSGVPMARGLRGDSQSDYERVLFAATLARIDLPTARTLVEGIEKSQRSSQIVAAFGAFAEAAARRDLEGTERLLDDASPLVRRYLQHSIGRALAVKDINLARRFVERIPNLFDRFSTMAGTAHVLSTSDRTKGEAAFREALTILPAAVEATPQDIGWYVAARMPLAERINSDLTSEVFWRALSVRRPGPDPRDGLYLRVRLAQTLGPYDREVARVLLEPAIVDLRSIGDQYELTSFTVLLAAGAIDPRLAADLHALLPEPIDPRSNLHTNWATVSLARALGLRDDTRWINPLTSQRRRSLDDAFVP